MFYLRYLRAELVRRRGRTIVTLLGLAVGVGLVIAIASLSKGLDEAQSATLDPLAGIGTDLTVTRTAEEDAGGGPFGGGGARDVLEANRAVDDRSVEARQGRHAVRARLLPAGGAADVHAGAGERDRRARGRRRGLGRTDAAGGAPGREGAEDRREHPDGRRPDRREPRDLAADRGRAGEDPGLPHEARLPGSGPGAGAESRPGANPAAASAAGKAATSGSAAARSRNASPSGCGASGRRSRRRARRCSRCSTRRRPTSRASRTRSAASSWATRRWAS